MVWKLRGEPLSHWNYAIILMLCYCIGELGHFLIGTLSKSQAQEIKFGNQRCIPLVNQQVNSSIKQSCYELNSTLCGDYVHDNKSLCEWNYDGSGMEYQVLAGPAFIAVFSLAGLVLGVLGDLYNRIRLLTFCVFLYSSMAFLTGLSTQYWHLIIFRMGFALGEAGITPLTASIIADKFGSQSRALAMSLFNWGIYVGYGLAFCVGIYVTELDVWGKSWRFSYFATGIPGILMTLILFLVLREPPRKSIVKEVDADENVDEVEISEADSGKLSTVESHHGVGNEITMKLYGSVRAIITRPPVMLLLLAASVRHTASFCWAYNAKLYFEQYYPDAPVASWMAFASIVGGSFGIISGGLVSDFIASAHGVSTRLWVLVISQGLATPLAAMVVYLNPPYCFISLFCAYFFAEMWYGVMLTSLVEMVPLQYRTTCIAISSFTIANIAGNLPVLVALLKQQLSGGLRAALIIMYPGFYFLSSILFLITQLAMSAAQRKQERISGKQINNNKEQQHENLLE